jgi:xylan 1,4-beta-xylosidase
MSTKTLSLFLLAALAGVSFAQERTWDCDKPRNAQLPFCDSSLSIEARVADLIGRLTLDEKIGAMHHTLNGALQNVDLEEYNWWNEALHGVAYSPGTRFRPPTEYSTAFPQIISFASSFNKDLFFRVANATGNEAR